MSDLGTSPPRPSPPRARDYLTVDVGGEVCALPLSSVREVVNAGPITPMPQLPRAIRGVANLRGRAVPVVDLGAHLGFAATTPGPRACFVVVESEGGDLLGLLVHEVRKLFTLSDDQFEPVPDFGAAFRREYVAGLVKLDGRFVMLLHVERALAREELLQLRAALAEERPGATDAGGEP